MTAVPVRTFVDMPGWRPILKRIGTNMALVSFIPMGIFYTALAVLGLRVGVASVVGWYYGMVVLNLVRRKPVLGAGLLGAGVISIRAVVTFITGSAFVFFLQPVAGTIFTATLIAATALAGRPILDRIAHDFCAFPPEMSAKLRHNKFFFRISVLWSMTYFLNAAGTVWLLTNASLNRFMVLKSAATPVIIAVTVVASWAVFRWTVRHENVSIRWANHQSWGAVSARPVAATT
jgi:hypothetical protein